MPSFEKSLRRDNSSLHPLKHSLHSKFSIHSSFNRSLFIRITAHISNSLRNPRESWERSCGMFFKIHLGVQDRDVDHNRLGFEEEIIKVVEIFKGKFNISLSPSSSISLYLRAL